MEPLHSKIKFYLGWPFCSTTKDNRPLYGIALKKKIVTPRKQHPLSSVGTYAKKKEWASRYLKIHLSMLFITDECQGIQWVRLQLGCWKIVNHRGRFVIDRCHSTLAGWPSSSITENVCFVPQANATWKRYNNTNTCLNNHGFIIM